MPLGIRYELGTISVGDTAELYAGLQVEGEPVPASEIASVEFLIQTPDGQVHGPFTGELLEDGRGYYRWSATEELGEYVGLAQFTTSGGDKTVADSKTSVLVGFAVEDPLKRSPQSPEEIVAEAVWTRLEDAFDSVEGGPWLRDETRTHFDKNKIIAYIPETLAEINVQMPLTNLNVQFFAQPAENEVLPLLVKGVLCRVIMHLIRSYIEIPIPQGGQVVYEDRTKYKDAWRSVYDSEYENFLLMVRLWKRGFLQLGRSRLLVGSKAGRLFPFSNFRLQNAGRGYF